MKRYIATLLLLAACASVQAREVFPLNEGWRFFFKSENSSDNARHVTLPHTWNTDTGACGYFLETTANYQNDMYVPAEWASKRLFVKFYGVQNVADLFVNGYHVGAHRGGSTAFTFEITDKIRFGEDNALLVVVSNNSRDDVLPASTDMNLYGGIYREAELILTGKTAVSPLHLGSEGVLVRQNSVTSALVEGEAEIYLTSAGESTCMLTLDITAPDGRKVFTKRQKTRLDGRPVVIPFSIADPQLWSPSSPALYRVTASIGEETVTDSVTVRTGFRNIQVTTAGGLTINGERIPVHGVTLYHDNAISGGAVLAQDYDADLQQIRDLGANALRSAVMPHAQYLYDRCDEQGLLVWVDSPLHRSSFLGDVAYFATPQFEQNGIQQLQEIIAQNYNHPSVVMWGIFSRLWMRGDDVTPYIRELHTALKRVDPSRPTVALSNQDGELNTITDLIALKQNVGWMRGTTDDVGYWCETLHKSWGNLLAAPCYGVPGYPSQQDDLLGRPTPGTHWLPERWQTRFHEEYARRIVSDPAFWGEWVNAMFDFGTARGANDRYACGMVTLDRRQKKDIYYLYRTLWNRREPTLYIAERRWRVRPSAEQRIKVYSSGEDPVLLVNGDSVALTKYAEGQFRADCKLLPGENRIEARCGELRDSVALRVGTALKARDFEALRKTKGLRSKD